RRRDVRDALPRHAVRLRLLLAPGGIVPRRVAGRPALRPVRHLHRGMVAGRGARRVRGHRSRADRGASGPPPGSRLRRMDKFRALLVTRDEATKVQSVGLREISAADLMDGDVDVRVEHSTINYKDGLAITGKLPVVRRFPMIPGVDFAGTVTASRHPDYKPGDKVILNGWGVGEVHHGGYAQMARVKGDWLIALPEGLGTAEAMAIGTAGYTAMLALMALERHGVTPASGAVIATGASGGLGSFAVALLADRGFKVAAATGRSEEADYLKRLGAAEVVARAELGAPPRPLGKERWAGAVDAVGGVVLANLISMTLIGGAIA